MKLVQVFGIPAIVAVSTIALVGCGSGSKDDGDGSNNGGANNGSNDAASNNATNNGPNNATTGGTNDDAEATVTYYQDVKPLLDAHCVECHTAGGIGPFPLDDYDGAKDAAPLVSVSVQNKIMPPFLYDTTCREPHYDPALSDDQIGTIVDWVEQGAAEGDPSAEAAPLELEKPEPLEFDTELSLPLDYVPLQSPDDYRCFVIDWPHETRRYVTGFGVIPGQEQIVHHVIAFLATGENVALVEQMDAAEGEPGDGYTCFGGPGFDEINWVGSWAPGGFGASAYPDGTGIDIPPGSKVVVQMHYNTLTEEPVPDKTKIQFRTADRVDKVGFWLPWTNFLTWLNGTGMRIPAGEENVTHTFSFDPTPYITDGEPFQIYAAALHMHVLGTSANTWITRGSGEAECLADIPRWDFNWQSGISFEEPVMFNPGDRLGIECQWDNSEANQPIIDGRRITPEDRYWGEGTTDEMCLGLFYITL